MSATRARLHAISIILAIEEDLRSILITYLPLDCQEQGAIPKHTYDKLTTRFTTEYETTPTDADLNLLLDFLDFPDAFNLVMRNRRFIPSNLFPKIENRKQTISDLFPIRNRVFHGRPLHSDDYLNTVHASETLINDDSRLWHNLSRNKQALQENPSAITKYSSYILTDADTSHSQHNLPTSDFDDTGLIGRENKERELFRKIVHGPYPVISVLGEGGIGKTALAVKVAYDILDSEDNPFDAIIFSSSRTKTLSHGDIVSIKDAITTSMRLIQTVAHSTLGPKSSLHELLEYMASFPILLILDNLETVLDDNIMSFLSSIPTGSKVLITSRIGLGAFENPVKIEALQEKDSVVLLRLLSKLNGLEQLTATSDRNVTRYCNKLHRNPGFIRWFVSAVLAGTRPEKALENTSNFLSFCMANIYNYLERESKEIIKVMIVIKNQLHLPEIVYYSGLPPEDVQNAINALMRTNFITHNVKSLDTQYVTLYQLRDLARDYLSKNIEVPRERYSEFIQKRNRLRSKREDLRAAERSAPYSPYTISLRSMGSDSVVAKLLTEVLRSVRRESYERAIKLVQDAKDMAPQYFEVFRVEGWLYAHKGDYLKAKLAYETAIELEPRSASLYYFYGGFLARFENDAVSASEQLRIAHELDPASVEIVLELARMLLYCSEHDQFAALIKDNLRELDGLTGRPKRKYLDLRIQSFHRFAETKLKTGDYIGAINLYEEMRSFFNDIDAEYVDKRLISSLVKSLRTLDVIRGSSSPDVIVDKARELFQWLQRIERQIPTIEKVPMWSDRRYKGKIARLVDTGKKRFGFLISEFGENLYFSYLSLRNRSEWYELEEGSVVSFAFGRNKQGKCAVDLVIASG